ncbi:hypothetical protein V6N13_029208 [Hibiscus sabdariffa]
MGEPTPSEDPRLPKKQRRRDEEPPDKSAPPALADPSIDGVTPGSDSVMPDAPAPQPPLDPYGPWMLIENRRRRPSKSTPQPKVVDVSKESIVRNSRYNPIYIENDPVSKDLIAAAVTPSTDARPDTGFQIVINDSNVPESNLILDVATTPPSPGGKSKLKSKTPIVLRNSASIALKPRDMNVMPRKSINGTGLSASSSKTRMQTKRLNPSKHTTIVMSASDPPISLSHNNLRLEHSSSSQVNPGLNGSVTILQCDSDSARIVEQTSGISAMQH